MFRHQLEPTDVPFARQIQTIVTAEPSAQTIHLVMENLNTHGETSRTGISVGRQVAAFGVGSPYVTPKHGSWLNQAEIELSLVARQCLGTRRIAPRAELSLEIRAWNTRQPPPDAHPLALYAKRRPKKFNYRTNLSKRSETGYSVLWSLVLLQFSAASTTRISPPSPPRRSPHPRWT